MYFDLDCNSLNFRQRLSSNLHFRQFNGSKTRIVDKVGMRNLWVLIELAATNCFQRRQRIASSHSCCCCFFLCNL